MAVAICVGFAVCAEVNVTVCDDIAIAVAVAASLVKKLLFVSTAQASKAPTEVW